MKKLRIFLAGYINSVNAQNLNCRALAKHLDKDKFKVTTMTVYSGTIPTEKSDFPGVEIIRIPKPFRLLRPLAYLWGIMRCDVAYLPKGEKPRFTHRLVRLFGKRSMITVEGVMTDKTLENAEKAWGDKAGIKWTYNSCDKTYSITEYMVNKNKETVDVDSDGVLYLGTEISSFPFVIHDDHSEKPLNLLFIGNDMRRKGIDDIWHLAEIFPDVQFHIAGSGNGYDAAAEISKRGLENVTYHGCLSPDGLAALLRNIDIHVFPSRSEGFPKVTLETAAMGVPSLVYGDYGAAEWITSGKDGWVVDTLEEMESIINSVKNNRQTLTPMRKAARQMAERFDWAALIPQWEQAFIDTYNVRR